LTGEGRRRASKHVELGGLIHKIVDATSYAQAEAALATLLGIR
jgi:hypothetical protein